MLSDTPPSIIARHDELLRELGEVGRLERSRQLTLAVQRLAFAGMRARFPQASDDEIWLRLAVERLGPDLVRRIYGFEVNPE